MRRLILGVAFLAAAIVAMFIMHAALPDALATVLLDKGGLFYPWSVQNIMWLFFFFGLAELLNRFFDARIDQRQLSMNYLPEDETTILVKTDLPPIYKKVTPAKDSEKLFLPGLIRRIVAAFQTTGSIESASAILNSSIELRSHDLDLRYSILRYVMWVIPTFGFIGTVVGIALALNFAGQPGKSRDPALLTELTARLAVAFNTTLVALAMSAFLVFLMHVVQSYEERTLNKAGHYCMDNLVNRLFKADDEGA